MDHEGIKKVADGMADLRRRQRALEQPKAKVKLDIDECRTKIEALKESQVRRPTYGG